MNQKPLVSKRNLLTTKLRAHCVPDMKHVWCITRILKNALILKSETGENSTTASYSETTKPEKKIDKKGL